MKTLSWNVWGLNNPLKCHRLREFILEIQPDWVGIQELKLGEVGSNIIDLCFGSFDFMFAFSPSIELARGIICFWRLTHYCEISRVCQLQFVAIKGDWITRDELEVLLVSGQFHLIMGL